MPFVADHAYLGFLPGQHHDTRKRYDLNLRYVNFICRIETRDGKSRYVFQRNSAGDLHGYMLWRQVDQNARKIPMWRHVFPAVVMRVPRRRILETPPEVGTVSRQPNVPRSETSTESRDPPDPLPPDLGKHGLQPVRLESFAPDTRFRVKEPSLPATSSDAPKGHPVLVATGCEELDQVELAFLAWHGLTATRVAGDPKLSSKVHDLKDDGSYDAERAALLHSVWGVVKAGSAVFPANAVGWQIGLSTRDGQMGYGLCIDNAETPPEEQAPEDEGNQEEVENDTLPRFTPDTRGFGNVSPGRDPGPLQGFTEPRGDPATQPGAPQTPHRIILGCAGRQGGGPFHLGGVNDIHRLGHDGDGNPVNPVHVSQRAVYYGGTGDAGLEWDPARYTKPEPLPFTTPVYLRMDPDSFHLFRDQVLPGLFRWESASAFAPITPPLEPPPTGGGGTGPRNPTIASDGEVTAISPPFPGEGDVEQIPVTPRGSGGAGGGGRRPPPGQVGPQPTPRPDTFPPIEVPGRRRRHPKTGPTIPGMGPVIPGEGKPLVPLVPIPEWIIETCKKKCGKHLPSYPAFYRACLKSCIKLRVIEERAKERWRKKKEAEAERRRRKKALEEERRGRRRIIGPTRREVEHRDVVGTGLEIGVPTILVIPQSYNPGDPDLRNDLEPAVDAKGILSRRPIVLRVEGMVAKVYGSQEPLYSQKPCQGRYPNGTARGAWVLTPPEVGLEDAGESMVPEGVPVSESGLVVGPGTYLAYGTPKDTAEKALISLGHVTRPNALGETVKYATDGTTENEIQADTQSGSRFGHGTTHDLGRERTGITSSDGGAVVKVRRGTLALLPTLADGEIYVATNVDRVFVGA